MNLIQRPEIFAKYHNAFPREHPATQIVVHGTGGGSGSLALIDGWILTPTFERAAAYRNGEGFSFNIDYDGTIYQFTDPRQWWHYHSSSWRGYRDAQGNPDRQREYDSWTIGIELMNPAARPHENEAPYTEAQYQALLELIIGELLPEIPTISS
jgi:hypothetical protein